MGADCLKIIKRRAYAAVASLLLVATVMPVAAVAQDAPAEKGELRMTPYIWAAGFQGTLGVPNSSSSGLPGSRVDTSFGKLVDNIEITGGGMLMVDWRKGKWSLFGDWTYAALKSDVGSPFGALYSGVEGQVKGNVVQGAVGYALLQEGETRVDVYGGLRYYDVNVLLRLQPGLLTQQSLTVSQAWTDGVIGTRYEGRMGGNWYETIQLDVGKGGSNFAAQGSVAIAYRYSWGDITGGWRYLKADYEKNSFKYDVALSGPFLGASFRF